MEEKNKIKSVIDELNDSIIVYEEELKKAQNCLEAAHKSFSEKITFLGISEDEFITSLLKQYKLKQWQLVQKIGVGQSTYIRWLNNGLTPEQLVIVVKALNELITEKMKTILVGLKQTRR